MRVREAGLADVPRLAEIRNGDTEAGPADPRMQRYLAGTHHPRDARGPRAMYLALEGDRIAGYIAGHLTTRFDCDGELQYLYVARDHRRRGTASALLRALAGWFIEQDARRICVDVVPENVAARSLYRRHGAVELNRGWMVWGDIGRLAAKLTSGIVFGQDVEPVEEERS
jgi:ribosomal protein S18 acetylase RimI-like enzyme